ncbi:tail fiber protein [Xenorhabdus kozodoii]|uniref:Tail fiber protein n=1 Tax=Xenorhabdus kozodoii TaxID=351676 RepID=A0A2D0L3Z5_9GAMM|nr:hypothetical protein [Xenorhabdus kozodoii]PHM70401.1 tail fiber protein [Xenorhabdus kozodoii]
MQKIGDVTNTADSNGEFTNGNVAAGVPPTLLEAPWFNTVQREIINALAAAGIQPNKHNDAQLSEAIRKLISSGALEKSKNGADIPNKNEFVKNLGLSDSVYRTIGNGRNQIPDMSFFTLASSTSRGLYATFPSGLILQSFECDVPGTAPRGYVYPLPFAFPNLFSAAILTPRDGIGDITIAPTYTNEGAWGIRIFNWSGGGNVISVICMGY